MDYADMNSGLFTTFGVALTYTDPDGVETSTSGVFEESEPVFLEEDDGEVQMRHATVQLDSDDVADPVVYSKVTNGSDVWTTVRVRALPTGAFELDLTLSAPEERTHGSYRKRRGS